MCSSKKTGLMGLGITMTILSIILIGWEIATDVLLGFGHILTPSGAGYWAGILYMVVGILATIGGHNESKRVIIGAFVMSIISMVIAGIGSIFLYGQLISLVAKITMTINHQKSNSDLSILFVSWIPMFVLALMLLIMDTIVLSIASAYICSPKIPNQCAEVSGRMKENGGGHVNMTNILSIFLHSDGIKMRSSKNTCLMGSGITTIILSIILIGWEIATDALLGFGYIFTPSGAGYWAGILYIVVGILATIGGHNKSKIMIIGGFVMSIISMVIAGIGSIFLYGQLISVVATIKLQASNSDLTVLFFLWIPMFVLALMLLIMDIVILSVTSAYICSPQSSNQIKMFPSKNSCLMGSGITTVILSIVLIGWEIATDVLLSFGHVFNPHGTGYWAGILYMVVGILATAGGHSEGRGVIIGTFVMSLITMVIAGIGSAFLYEAVIMVAATTNLQTSNGGLVFLFTEWVPMLVLALVLLIMDIVILSVTSTYICCSPKRSNQSVDFEVDEMGKEDHKP